MGKLEVNDGIRIKENGVWNRARVTASHASPRSYIVQSATGSVLHRNRRHLLKTAEHALVVVPDFESLPVGPSLEPGSSPTRGADWAFTTSPASPTISTTSPEAFRTTRFEQRVKPPNRLDL